MVELSIEDRVSLVEAVEDDAYLLADISKRAFESDVEVGAKEPGGPPGYDSYKDQVRYMEYFDYYRITLDDYTVGGVMTAHRGEGHRELVRIFVDPESQRQGVGLRAMELVMSLYPGVKLWTLGTPEWNTRTRSFYEKLGFTQVGWTEDAEGRGRWYQKTLGEGVSFQAVGELMDGMRNVTVEGEIEEKAMARMVRSRRRGETLSVTEVGLVDASGRVLLTLWNEQIRQVGVGDRLRVENGYVSSYRGILQLNVGRAGKLVKLI
jgi:GNAT superfamily N-acetyltransferase